MKELNTLILEKTALIENEITKYRRHIHNNPELSFEEFETAAYIRKHLDDLNIDYKIFAETGTAAVIGNGKKCVALRADIDALPIPEESGLEFASSKKGVMHACGHDMHTAMLMGAAKVLKEMEDEIPGQIKLIFQPGEEKVPGGALQMIEAGVLDNPKPLAVFGQHVNPGETVGTIAMAPGPIMASADEIYWTIRGKGGHAAQPHMSNDAILAAANMITFMQSLITKFRNPLTPGVLSVTSIHGGSATNIFPDEVKMMGTLRAFDRGWRDKMHELIEERSKAVCGLFNAECEVDISKGYYPVINNESTTRIASEAAAEIFGADKVIDFEPKMWAEDFGYFAEALPSTFWFVGVRPEGSKEAAPLHNPKFNPDEKALAKGAAMMVYTALRFLNEK